jgi:hypothetical protein
MERHERALRVLEGLADTARSSGLALGYEVHHDGQSDETKQQQQDEMLAHWKRRLATYHAQKRAGAKADHDALPKVGGDFVLLEVTKPGALARVVRCVEMDTLLSNSSRANDAIVAGMVKECLKRDKA